MKKIIYMKKENNEQHAFWKEIKVISKIIGRNDPCPCGSGKKYKKCCGSNKN